MTGLGMVIFYLHKQRYNLRLQKKKYALINLKDSLSGNIDEL